MQRRKTLIAAAATASVLMAIPVVTALGQEGGEQVSVEASTAVSNAITYQGRITDNGQPASGTYDLRFILFDAESGGAQAGLTVFKPDVAVTGGLFTVSLDFGESAWDGNARWIEIAIRPGDSGDDYAVLSPRQALTAVPYALHVKYAGSVTATGTGATSTALEISNGAIKVTGANKPAFIHTVAEETPSIPNTLPYSRIDHPLANGDPNALLFVTRNMDVTGTPASYSVAWGIEYDPVQEKWAIVSEDGTTAIPAGTRFNVLVIKQ